MSFRNETSQFKRCHYHLSLFMFAWSSVLTDALISALGAKFTTISASYTLPMNTKAPARLPELDSGDENAHRASFPSRACQPSRHQPYDFSTKLIIA